MTANDWIDLMGMRVACLRSSELLDMIERGLCSGEGGWVVTANLDILRLFCQNPDARAVYEAADLRVADGMPLVWASRIAKTPLPERIAGSSLVEPLIARCARNGHSVFLMGGAPGSAEKAATLLRERYTNLKIEANSKLMVSVPPTAEQVTQALSCLGQETWDVVLVGLGSPKQEFLIQELRPKLARSWLIGVGISFGFLAGDQVRAPVFVQRVGLEWLHRMLQEPKRLGRRYLLYDIPFFLRVMQRSLKKRFET